MSPIQSNAIDQSHMQRQALSMVSDASRPGALRRLYRQSRNKLYRSWRLAWLKRSGPNGFGRVAAGFAAWGTTPYHGRAALAEMTSGGFIAASAAISHPDLRLGEHVYIGDNVIVVRGDGGDSVSLRDRVHLYGDSFLETGMGGGITIGEGTHIQPGCHLHAFLSDISIGEGVEIASGCGFFSYDHGMELGQRIMDQPLKSEGGISVGDGAWLGYRVTVLQNVTIGAGAVVAAGSVVVRDIPENAIAAGVPAKVIKYRTIGTPMPIH